LTFGQLQSREAMSTYVLIHGAWHGAWCWAKIRAALEAEGHRVVTPDLPGHGDDSTPLGEVSLDAYARRVSEVLDAEPEPVVLVGHSMGGMVITAAAERQPRKVRALVYLCAFLPGDGDTLMSLAAQSDASLVLPNLETHEEGGYATVKDEGIAPAFYGRCDEQDVALAKSRLVPQALRPLDEPVTVTAEGAGAVPRYYIECLDDHAIPLPLQRQMVDAHPFERVFTLASDHSPFFSAVEELTECLLLAGSDLQTP
jgi:pimeloyl-ACP methyl ester carboxylesterase